MVYGKIRSTYDEVMQQDIDDKSETVMPRTQSPSAEVATRRSDGSRDSSSQTVHEHFAIETSAPKLRFHATKDVHKPPRLIHPYQVSDRLESKGADPFLSHRMRRFRRTNVPKERPTKVTASVPGKIVPRKISVQLKHDSLTPLIHTYQSDHNVPPATEHPPRITASAQRKIFAKIFARLKRIRPFRRIHIPKERPPKVTASARRKIFAHFKHNTLAPLIRNCISDHLPSATEYPLGKTSIGPRKVFAQLVCDSLAQISRTQTSEDSFLPPQSESARGGDEPSSDELLSWLDELHALVTEDIVSDTPDVTTKTDFSLPSPHSSPQYPSSPPASSWNPTSNRQSLEHSKTSFSTWGSKAAKRHYTTAAVSKN